MNKILEKLFEKFDFPIWFLIFGFIFVISGFYEIENLRELRIDKLEKPDLFILLLGILFVTVSAILYYLKIRISQNSKKTITQKAEQIMKRDLPT